MERQSQLNSIVYIALSLLFFIAVIASMGIATDVVMAQEGVVATDTATAEPPTPTFTPQPPTVTPPTVTPPASPTPTPTSGGPPPAPPVNIPEPFTVVLFGTGLAALSAAAAARRK